MRISRLATILAVAVPFAIPGAERAAAFDDDASPRDAFRSGYAAYKSGDTSSAVEALNYAAEKGHPAALWKLGRMYAAGDGVRKDERKAFAIFTRIANDYADDNPRSPDSRFVSSAFVALGDYYRIGVPGVEANHSRARRFFAYAASYFGDAEAQFRLASMVGAGHGGDKNARQAARWYKLAATKGHAGAQAEFGRILFHGDGVQPDPVKGLMWLTIARQNHPGDIGIQALHEEALSLADDSQRRTAVSQVDTYQQAGRQPAVTRSVDRN